MAPFNIFNIDRDVILNASDRDGIRIYASGTIIKLFYEVLDYSVDDIMKLIKKPRSIISKHKSTISNLDYKHPQERPILKQYLFCKHELIKFILIK